jgi:acetate kinase
VTVLVLNCGSSSVKLALVDPTSGERRLTALAERVGTAEVTVRVRRGEDEEEVTAADPSHRGVVGQLLTRLTDEERRALVGVGHRLVHGGDRFAASVLVDDGTLAVLRDLAPLAPLHAPANLAGLEVVSTALPDLPHVAVFDTAFHQTMPPVAYRYAVPASWYAEHGVRRYGFHGTSHRYVAGRAAEMLGRPPADLHLVTLHLGNGCSAAAVARGRSVDTTMGLTPLEGLVMGTRSGDVDPGLFGYLGRRLGLDAEGVLAELNTRSGLLGLSGTSNDMRAVCAAAEDAELALEVFCYRAAKAVGALSVALGALDAVVFTGGIGEQSAVVRRRVLERLGVLGLRLDPVANADHGRRTAGRVSASGEVPGEVTALVVPTDEELLIARDTVEVGDRGTSREGRP